MFHQNHRSLPQEIWPRRHSAAVDFSWSFWQHNWMTASSFWQYDCCWALDSQAERFPNQKPDPFTAFTLGDKFTWRCSNILCLKCDKVVLHRLELRVSAACLKQDSLKSQTALLVAWLISHRMMLVERKGGREEGGKEKGTQISNIPWIWKVTMQPLPCFPLLSAPVTASDSESSV